MRRNSFSEDTGFERPAVPLGGATWEQTVDEDGTSFAAWAGIKGTWSSDGTIIKNTDTSATAVIHRANLATKVVLSACVIEMEVRLPTAGQGAVPNYIGFYPGMSLATTNSLTLPRIAIRRETVANTSSISWGIDDAVLVGANFTVTINLDVWYKVRAVLTGNRASLYLDGVLIGTVIVPGVKSGDNVTDLSYLGLMSYSALAHFRNIKVWNLTEP